VKIALVDAKKVKNVLVMENAHVAKTAIVMKIVTVDVIKVNKALSAFFL
jgi:hypothetical protein